MSHSRSWSYYFRPRCSGLCVFVVIYVSLFAGVGIVLFSSLFQLPKSRTSTNVADSYSADNIQYEVDTKGESSKYYFVPESKELWNLQLYGNKTVSNVGVVEHHPILLNSISGLRWPYNDPALINCTSLQEISNLEFIAAGWTKAVYKGQFRGKDVAVKTVNLNGHDIHKCQQDPAQKFSTCYQKTAAKMLKEIILLTELTHENIIKVLGSCVPETGGPISLVTELGEPLDSVRLLQLSWEDRLRLVLGVANLIHHLANSPLGSLSMNDFRRQQFVTVDGVLKLSDVDDLGVGEPDCETDMQCRNIFMEKTKINFSLIDKGVSRIPSCVKSVCQGHNAQLNIWRAGQRFVKLLLPISAPASLEPHIHELLAGYDFQYLGSEWDSARILESTEQLVDQFKSGRYLSTNRGIEELGFEELPDSDLPGMFDYWCRRSVSAVSCVMSVFNDVEAAQLCAQYEECKAVVLSQQLTWAGRTVAILKNGFSPPSTRTGFRLLVKKG